MAVKQTIKIGTRGSDLALAQTAQLEAGLRQRFPNLLLERVILRTQGDRVPDQPLPDFGGKGVFVEDLEEALLDGRIDLAVHSAKDMPTGLATNLVIAGVLPREDARDVLVSSKVLRGDGHAKGPARGFGIGTGSLRRQFQIRELYPGAVCKGLRGNVPTRIQKLREGELDGVILAAAGLKRLGICQEADLAYRYFSYEEMVPAGGQGIIAVEGRKGDPVTRMVQEISDAKAWMELKIERGILRMLDAGCHEAVGVVSQYKEDAVRIWAVRQVPGQVFKEDRTTKAARWEELARELVRRLQGTPVSDG